jgi:hypothetical protein
MANNRVRLQWGMHADADAREVSDAFVDILRGREAVELLAALSNENLHSLFGKIQMIAQSNYFRDQSVMRELFARDTAANANQSGARLWLVLSLLLGNYNGTFKSSDDAASLGIVNVFCTRERNHTPYTQFVRLHLLARLSSTRKEQDAVPVTKLREEYMTLFGDDTHFSQVFERALRRLIIGALVFTTSFRRYKEEHAFWPQVVDDEVFITPAGRYYLHKLIGRVEYLWFMKDDIDWAEPQRFPCASTGASAVVKIRGTLAALCELTRLEYEMLDSVRARMTAGANVARRYLDLYSAARLPKARSPLFTDFICDRFLEHLAHKVSGYATAFARELECLDEVHERFSRTRASFS